MEEGKLSVCLVVKDEDKYLQRCLKSVQEVADEIIVVDTGSTARTVDVAGRFTQKIYSFAGNNNFSDARNFSLDQATGEWVLVLDGDEELDPQSIGPLREKIKQQEMDGYLIKVLKYYEAGTVIQVAADSEIRLFQNKAGYRYSGAFCEQISENISRANPEAKFGFAEDISLLYQGHLLEHIETQHKPERNTRLLEDSVNRDPDNLLNCFCLGVEYLDTNQPAKALEQFMQVYDKVSMQVSYAPQLMSSITTCRYLLSEYELALDFLEQNWINYFPDQGDLHYLKGVICRALGRQLEAYKAFSHCLKVAYQPPHYVNIHWRDKYKIYLELGQLAEFFMDKETALQLYMDALKGNPVLLEPLAKIIGILKPKENPDYTEECLNKFFDLTDQGVRVALGKVFFGEGAYALAVKYFSLAQAEGTASSHIQLLTGISCFFLKQYPRAIRELSQIPQGDAIYINAQSRLFMYYWACNLLNRAAGCLNNCRSAGAIPLLLDFMSGLMEDVKPESENQVGVKGNLPDLFTGLFELLIEFDRPKKLAQAIACLKGLVRSYPARLIGDLFYAHGKFEQAEAEYKELIADEQSDAQLLFRLGKTYQAMGKLAEAEHYLRQAISAGDESPKTSWEMARLYQELALETLEAAVEKYPANQSKQEIQKMMASIRDSLIEV